MVDASEVGLQLVRLLVLFELITSHTVQDRQDTVLADIGRIEPSVVLSGVLDVNDATEATLKGGGLDQNRIEAKLYGWCAVGPQTHRLGRASDALIHFTAAIPEGGEEASVRDVQRRRAAGSCRGTLACRDGRCV